MIEFLPAILLFIVILIVSVVFFIGLIETTHIQESARKAPFSKKYKKGPLVSRSNRAGSAKHYEFPMSGTQNVLVDSQKTCFVAKPDGTGGFKLPSILGETMKLERIHKMTVFRQAAAPNTCE